MSLMLLQMKALIDRIVAADSNPASNVEQVSAMVQEFYLLFRQRLDTHVHFKSMYFATLDKISS